MSTLTLPLVAGAPYAGAAWFAARTIAAVDPDEAAVIWLDRPELVDRTLRWARDGEVRSAHVTLDRATVAELLFISTLDPDDGPTDAQLCDAVTRELARCHCDLRVCVDRLAVEYGEHMELAQSRMAACLGWAARIAGGVQ